MFTSVAYVRRFKGQNQELVEKKITYNPGHFLYELEITDKVKCHNVN